MPKFRIAVIGAGISGLSAAWLLSRRHHVTLFDKDARPGGHANTVVVDTPAGPVPVDTGFIVYNSGSYPNLIALFAHLQVPTAPASMSFAVSHDDGRYEYSGSGIQGLFGQPANLFRPAHWRLIADIRRFFRAAKGLAMNEVTAGASLGDWLTENGFSDDFKSHHILPMGAAIWSTPAADILDFPAAAFARFFANHGLLQVRNRPQWRTVTGGSREYVSRLIRDFSGDLRQSVRVDRVERGSAGVDLIANGENLGRFDQCVIACHADQALGLLADADGEERSLLSKFRYTANDAVLHSDTACMPMRRRLWSSWNYAGAVAGSGPSLSYWMNRLQPLNSATDYFVTLNPATPIDETRVIARLAYRHPLFDSAALSAQQQLWGLQGRRRTWFAGSYFGYGFHEDALQAGLAVAEQLGGQNRPWRLADPSGRIFLTPASGACAFREAAE